MALKTPLDPSVVSASANVDKVRLRTFLEAIVENLEELFDRPVSEGGGSSWYASSTVLSNTIGDDGDFNLVANGDVYEKVVGVWTATGVNLRGTAGTVAEVPTTVAAWLDGVSTTTLLAAVQQLYSNKIDASALEGLITSSEIPAIIDAYFVENPVENVVYSAEPTVTIADGTIIWAQPPGWDPLTLGGTAPYAVKKTAGSWAATLAGPPGAPGAAGASGTAIRLGRASAPTGISLKFGRATAPPGPALVPRVGTFAEWNAYDFEEYEWGVIVGDDDQPTGELVLGLLGGGVGQYKTISSELVTARQFGVVGNGIVDDVPALQFAVNTVGAAGGGRILISSDMILNFASYQLETSTAFSSQQFCILINYDNIEIVMEEGSVIRSSLVPRISTAGPGFGLWSGVGCLFFINGCRKNGGTIDTALVGRPSATMYEFDPAEKNDIALKLTDPADRVHFAVDDWIFPRTGQLTNNGANTADGEFNKITKIGEDGLLSLLEPLKKSYQPENYQLSYTNNPALAGTPAAYGIVNTNAYLLHNISLDIIIDAPFFNAIQQWQARAVDTRVRGNCRSIVHGGSWMKETVAHDMQVTLGGLGSETDPERPGDWAFSTGTGSSECWLRNFDFYSKGRNFIHIHEGSANTRVSDGRLKAIANRDNDSAISIRARAYNVSVENVDVTCTLPTLWTAGEVIVAGEYRRSGSKIYRALSSGTSGATAPTHTLATVSDGVVSWRPMEAITAWAADQTIGGRTFRLYSGHILHATRGGVTGVTGPAIDGSPAAGEVAEDAGGVEWEILKNDDVSSPTAWAAGTAYSNTSYRHDGGYLFQAATGGTSGTTSPSTALAALLDDVGGVYWVYAGTTTQTGVFVDESCVGGGSLVNVTAQVEGGPGISVRAPNWDTTRLRSRGSSTTVGVFLRERAERILIPAAELSSLVGTGVLEASSGVSTTAIVMPYWELKNDEFGRIGKTVIIPPEWTEMEIYLWLTNPNSTLGRVVSRAGLSEYRPGDLVGATATSVWTNLGSSVAAGHITTANGKIYKTAGGGTKGTVAPSHSNLGVDNGTQAIGVTWRYLGLNTAWTTGQAVTAGVLRTANGNIYRALGDGTTGATTPSGTTTSSDGSVTWGYVSAFSTWTGGIAYFDAIASSGSYVTFGGKLYGAYATGLSGDAGPSHTDLGSDGSITDWQYIGVDHTTSAAIFTANVQNALQVIRVTANIKMSDNRYPYLFTIERDGSHASDTLAGDIRLHYVELRRSS